MKAEKSPDSSKTTNWKITGLFAVIAALVFFWPFVGIIVFTIVITLLFQPLHAWLSKYMSRGLAAGFTILLSVAIVFIPVAFITVLAIAQGTTFAANIASALQVASSDPSHHEATLAIQQINSVLEPVTQGHVHLTVDSVKAFFSQTLPVILKSFVQILLSFASSIPSLITSVMIYLFLSVSFLTNGETLDDRIHLVSPFDDTLTELYIQRTRAIIHASIVSQLLIAFILGLLTMITIGIFIGGFQYFVFGVLLLTLLSMVPIGSSIVVYPLSIIAIIQGNVAGGIWVILIYSFVICNIDNIIRPRLIPKSLRIPSALMTLSIFSGIYYFGILGVIYGPIIIILLVATYETFISYKKESIQLPATKKA